MLYEASAEECPEAGHRRARRFAGRWVAHYVRHAGVLARAAARRAGVALGRRHRR